MKSVEELRERFKVRPSTEADDKPNPDDDDQAKQDGAPEQDDDNG